MIVIERFAYNDGNVFRFYDKKKDCIFYDIDCGCVFRNRQLNAKLACIRLEDEKIFLPVRLDFITIPQN